MGTTILPRTATGGHEPACSPRVGGLRAGGDGRGREDGGRPWTAPQRPTRRAPHRTLGHDGELSERTMVSSGAVSKRVDRLEGRGLVERRPSADDGRSRTVVLTPAGRALVDEAMTAHAANEARLLEPLSTRERDQLGRLLARLAVSLGV